MMQLTWRFFKKSWRVQLAITGLFAVSVTLLIVYGTYLEREGRLLHLKMLGGLPHDLIRVQVRAEQEGATSLRRYQGAGEVPVVHVGSWRVEVVQTNYGNLPTAVIAEDTGLDLHLEPGEVSIPQVMSTEHSLSVGDQIRIKTTNGFESLLVAQIHDGAVFGNRLVLSDSSNSMSSVFLYRRQAGSLSDALAYLRRTYSVAEIDHAGSAQSSAQKIVSAVYSPGQRARFEAIGFVTIAFLTVTLFGFLEKRKVLAVVKALGLRTRELVALIAGEAVLPPLFGSILGCAMGYGALQWLIASGQEFTIATGVFVVAVASIWPAVVIGIAIPSRFTQVATVNQLLFERPIPLHTAIVKELPRRYAGLDVQIAQGARFVKLAMDQGQFNGFVFRGLNDYVKQGEVLAVEERWWGMQVIEYHAPQTGQITVFEQEMGLFGVAPEPRALEPKYR
ncbi:MAG: hypothetical protein FD169_1678 [Bacillota bacterium]|nr:MAG: hypothetical protein FD169_1678 [Bacillota bacterium]